MNALRCQSAGRDMVESAICSASVVEEATDCYFIESQDIAQPFNIKVQRDTERLVSQHEA